MQRRKRLVSFLVAFNCWLEGSAIAGEARSRQALYIHMAYPYMSKRRTAPRSSFGATHWVDSDLIYLRIAFSYIVGRWMLSSRIKKLRGVELACDQLRFEQLRKASNGKQTCPAASLCMKLGNELRPQMRPKKGHGWPGTRHKAGMDSIPARPFLTLLGTCSRKVRGLCCKMGAASGDSRTWTMQLIRAHVYILPRTVLAREISPTLAERGLQPNATPQHRQLAHPSKPARGPAHSAWNAEPFTNQHSTQTGAGSSGLTARL